MAQTLVVIALDPAEEARLRALMADAGRADIEMVTGSMQQAMAYLDSQSFSPEHILIDIGARGEDILGELDQLALHCEPTVGVVIIGSINDIHFYRALKERGIIEYFPRPVSVDDIRSALAQSALLRQQRHHASANGIVVSCMSAASGDGASTLAVNLSYCLAEMQHFPTVLVDMDYQFGLVAKGLDLTAPFGIRELFDYPDQGLDEVIVDKMLVKYGKNLKIIASPNELHLLPPVRVDAIHELIAILRTKFRFVVIDVPHVWTHWTAAALKNSDHTILVGQLWLRSLTHATRLFNAWKNAGISSERVSLVMNRSGAKFKEAVSAEEFERICRHPIDAHINNDIKSVVSAENQGRTVYEAALEGSPLPQQFRHVATLLSERFNVQPPIDVVVAAPAQKKGQKSGIKGFFDKK